MSMDYMCRYRTFVFFLVSSAVESIEIKRISSPVPDGRYARRVKTFRHGDCFAYESDAEYQYNGTGLPAFGDGHKNIWMTCGVFDDDPIHTLLSSPNKPEGADAEFVAISEDGSLACFHADDFGYDNIVTSTTDSQEVSYIVNTTDRKSTFCEVSPDGGTLVFQSNAELVPDVTVSSRKYQIYSTNDGGNTFKLVVGEDFANAAEYSLLSSYPQVSNDGSFITFNGKIPYGYTTSPTVTELFLYSSESGDLMRLTNFEQNKCNLTFVYEKMQEHWGAANLTAEGVTKASNTQCNFAAAQGWQQGANLLGAGHGPSRISDDGRFIAYTAGFDHATIRGTHSAPQVISADNLFLFDKTLGLTWQITEEGTPGDEFDAHVEEFCCPLASSSKQRDTCSQSNIYKGFCCWQRPCSFPAQWPDISGDGTSISFFTTLGHGGDLEHDKDYEIYHYHIPTSTFTVVTNTTHQDLDDTYPSISYDGTVTAFESDFDYEEETEIVSTNQVFAAKLAYGCPHYTSAQNYHPTPDVEVRCEWGSETPTTQPYEARVALYFSGDVTEMLASIPFSSSDDNDARSSLCSQYGEDVKNDLAFALEMPSDFLTIRFPIDDSECASWASGIQITVGLAYPTTTTTTTTTGAGGGASNESYPFFDGAIMASEIMDQYEDASSPIWKGYLTKTLRGDRSPEILCECVALESGGGTRRALLFGGVSKLCDGTCNQA